MNHVDTARWARIACGAALLATLAACGGGGGGGSNPPVAGPPPAPSPGPTPPPPPPPPPSSFTIGGTLTSAANLVLDSDTNDPNQSPRADNGDFDIAQAITASSQVMGTVNLPFEGPTGASYTGGDDLDGFKVTLAAGQTIELDFTADTSINDLDLYVFQNIGGSWQIVGESFGTSRTECVRVTKAGDYTIGVSAFEGASLYNLRVTAAGASSTCANATTNGAAATVAGELIVGAHADGARAERARARATAASLRTLRGDLQPGRLALMGLPDAPRQQALAAAPRGLGKLRAQLAPEAARLMDTLRMAKTLRKSGEFEFVMLNRVLSTTALVGTFPPNDTRYSLQRWHYEQIALPAAMQTLTALSPQPTQRPIVAVVDTGIVADHPDLAPQLVSGYDFIRDVASAGDNNGIDANPDDLRSRASQPSFHGSHVAGTVAAATFDGSGAAGVAPMAQIMPLRALGEGGSGTFYDITQAMRFAAGLSNDSGTLPARRADIINLSLGSSGTCDADTANFVASVRAQGTIIVAATGNDANRPAGQRVAVGYPANCAGVIAVAATDPQRGIAPYSNTGSPVSLAAPGGDMRFSTTGTGQPDGVYSTLATFDANGNRVPTFGNYQGTSMATPHVAGVLALMRWVYPALTPAQVDTLLAQGALSDDAGTAGRDADYGWGVVNAAKAVQAALTLRDGTPPPTTGGVIEAQPSTLDFGPTGTTLDFTLRTTGATAETVTSVTSSSAAVTVAAQSVAPATGLGTYRVTVDRNALPVGVSTPTITARTSARTLTVALSIEKRAPGGTPGGDLGPVYVLVFDATTNEVIAQTSVNAVGGRYTWSISNIRATSIGVIAGSDYDNDSFICSRGEACGAYPVLGAQVTPVTLTGNRSDLDFVLSPVGAGNAAGAAAAAAGQNRLPKPTLTRSGSTLKVPTALPAE